MRRKGGLLLVLAGALFPFLVAWGGCNAASRELEAQSSQAAQTAPVDREALGWLPKSAADGLSKASMPVLVPRDRAILANAQVVVEPAFYTLSSKADGATISFHGTKAAKRDPAFDTLQEKYRVRGAPALLTDNEGIKSLTWFENGTSFALDVECARKDDRRCSSTDYVISLANQMAYIGGAPAARAPARHPQ
jgi:hypothetical protein